MAIILILILKCAFIAIVLVPAVLILYLVLFVNLIELKFLEDYVYVILGILTILPLIIVIFALIHALIV